MTEPKPQILYTPSYRAELLKAPDAKAFRKTARIIAVQVDVAFVVETDRGPMTGKGGDWLVTNHPDDDPGSDLWSISDERMRATYQPAVEPSVEDHLQAAALMLTRVTDTQRRHPLDVALARVELALEDVAKYVVSQGVL